MPALASPGSLWTEAERRAWAPPPRLTVSEWAGRHYRIVSKDAAEPGPLRWERAPHAREIADALGPDDPVNDVIYLKPARVMGTETINVVLSFRAAAAPVPAILCYPVEGDAREQMREEVLPCLRANAGLSDDDVDQKSCMIAMPRMNMRIAWAASPAKLSRVTACFVAGDECDKWPPFSGREGSPWSLLCARTETWGYRAKRYLTSTPTTKNGAIWREWESCADKRYRFVPCPLCGALQRLAWANVRWEPALPGENRRQHADRLERHPTLVWYECAICKGRIEERHRAAMLNAGAWLDEHGHEPPKGSLRRGYWLEGQMYSLLGVTLVKLAARWLRAIAAREEGDLSKLMEFVNQALGQPFEEQLGKVDENIFARKAGRGYKPGEVPKWAGLVLATADTQRSYFKWVVRAWGQGERSRLLARGRAERFEDLERMTLGARFQVQGWDEYMAPAKLYIDAGGGGEKGDTSRTDEVYRFAIARPGRVQPVKGWGGYGRPEILISPRRITYKPPGEGRNPYEVSLMVLDTQGLKDLLANWIALEGDAAGEKWELPADIDAEYAREMTAERKVVERQGNALIELWKPLPGRARDFFDCEVYQIAAARAERVALMPDEDALERERFARAHPKKPEDRDGKRWVDGKGWWKGDRR